MSGAPFAVAPERNVVAFSVSDARGRLVTISDRAGAVPGIRCSRPQPADRTVAACAPDLSGGSVARREAALGDGDDRPGHRLTRHRRRRRPGSGRAHGRPRGRRSARRGRAGHGPRPRGDDALIAGTGGGAIFGGAGEDRLQGGSGPDILDGGRATDFLSGVGGNDVLHARDGIPDEVYCGRGRDRAEVDGVDFISAACEKRTGGRSGAATVIEPDYRFFSPSFSEGGTNLRIGCPGDGPRRCAGTVIVRRGTTVLGRGPFNIRRDRGGQARKVKPTKAGKGLPTGKPAKATVILVTRDRAGRRVVRSRAGSAEDFPASELE